MRSKTVAVAVVAMLVLSSLIITVSADAGDLDTTFGGDGMVVTDFGESSEAIDVAVQADGRVVAVGYAHGFAVARYNVSGTLDATFGIGGKVITNFSTSQEAAFAVSILSNGKILVGGYSKDAQAHARFALARYNTDGSLDTTFGTAGKVVTAFSNNDVIFDLAIQPDGRIVAAGWTGTTPGQSNNLAVLRYNANGALDTMFGSAGLVEIDMFGKIDSASEVLIQPDGHILVAGSAQYGPGQGGPYDFLLVRLNTDGSLDTTFGIEGMVLTDF